MGMETKCKCANMCIPHSKNKEILSTIGICSFLGGSPQEDMTDGWSDSGTPEVLFTHSSSLEGTFCPPFPY